MIKNYLTVSLRNLLKNKFYLIINVAGLGLALSTCIVAYLNSQFAMNFDGQHVRADKIYKVQIKKVAENEFTEFGINPLPLGPTALNDISDIKMQVRYTNPDLIVQKADIVLNKEIGFADMDFLDMFTYPMRLGDPGALKDKKKILLSAEMAEVYFGDKDPIGEILTLRNDEDKEFPFIVGGVFEKIPLNTSIYFDAIVQFDNYFDINDIERNTWERFVAATFFLIETPEQARTVEGLLSNYIAIQNEAKNDWKVAEYYMLPLLEFGTNSQNLFANWLNSGMHPAAFMAPPIMALLMLLIACFNFTNTSIAISSNRIKEIGIRKVMGGGKWQLIIQFMSENLMVCFMAIIVSLALANYLVPAYSAMWPDVQLNMDFMQNCQMYFFLFGLLIFTAIVAGAYPSIYISSFEPVKILRGTLRLGGAGRVSKILLSTQYLFTVMALFAGIAFIQNAQYQETLDLGFSRDTIIGARIDNHTDYLKLKNALVSNPEITAVVGSSEHIGRWDYTQTLKNEGNEIETFMLDFGPGYIEAMDLEILQGRSFKEELKESDQLNSLIVNEKLVNEFGWENPIGKRVALDDSVTLTVIGVVKNFHHNGFWREVDSYGIRLSDEKEFRFVIVRIPSSKRTPTYHYLEETWAAVIPTKPFTGFYQDELGVIKQAKDVNNNIVVIFGFLAVLSVILSGIGLFTLVSLNIIRRIKEIGIRKVLGARIASIVGLMNKPFASMIALGGSLGLLAGYFIADMLMGSIFVYYKSANAVTFLIPLGLILLISMLTSSTRIIGAARRNPVDSLRYE